MVGHSPPTIARPGLAKPAIMVRMSDIALLAPVPLMHLDSAARDGLDPVAFGSEAWDVLKHLPPEGDNSIPVLIYASLADAIPFVTWRGEFAGWIDPARTPLAELARMRPASTRAEGNPEPLWGSYWLVRGLRQLPTAEWLAIAKLWKRDGSGRLATSFVLEGPILIKAP